MSLNKISFSEHDTGLGQLGGGAWLHDMALWPKAPDTGEFMVPVIMLKPAFCKTPFIPEGMAVTVFVDARRDGESYKRSMIRKYTIHQTSEFDKTSSGHVRVTVHKLADRELFSDAAADAIPKRYLSLIPMTDEEFQEETDDEISGVGISKQMGRPGWLQDPIFPSPRYHFMAQILDSDITKISPCHEGIFGGGIGYLFMDYRAKKATEGQEAGYFFIQFT